MIAILICGAEHYRTVDAGTVKRPCRSSGPRAGPASSLGCGPRGRVGHPIAGVIAAATSISRRSPRRVLGAEPGGDRKLHNGFLPVVTPNGCTAGGRRCRAIASSDVGACRKMCVARFRLILVDAVSRRNARMNAYVTVGAGSPGGAVVARRAPGGRTGARVPSGRPSGPGAGPVPPAPVGPSDQCRSDRSGQQRRKPVGGPTPSGSQHGGPHRRRLIHGALSRSGAVGALIARPRARSMSHHER
jgi:hypothetical protein